MPGRLGPRFALEAGFLILLAVALGLADLDTLTIVAVMAVAWLLVALIEWIASREQPVAVREAERQSFVATSGMAPAEEEPSVDEQAAETPPSEAGLEPVPAEVKRRRWFRRRRRAPEQVGEGG
jgi:hypothetical protein